jgi:pyruvate/2-oxoglutarate/acetoin dehydrogenase E1 component
MATVLRSVEKTRRLLVVHEAHRFLGVGAEIVATVAEAGIDLAARPGRLGAPDVRIPAAPALLAAVIPGPTDIADAVRAMTR